MSPPAAVRVLVRESPTAALDPIANLHRECGESCRAFPGEDLIAERPAVPLQEVVGDP